MITKDIIINSFKESCFKWTSYNERLICYTSQYQRHAWQIQTVHGLTRIEKKEGEFTITLFPFTDNLLKLNDKVCFKISESEYEELKCIYMPPVIFDYIPKIKNRMKYRIEKITLEDGSCRYLPQYSYMDWEKLLPFIFIPIAGWLIIWIAYKFRWKYFYAISSNMEYYKRDEYNRKRKAVFEPTIKTLMCWDANGIGGSNYDPKFPTFSSDLEFAKDVITTQINEILKMKSVSQTSSNYKNKKYIKY